MGRRQGPVCQPPAMMFSEFAGSAEASRQAADPEVSRLEVPLPESTGPFPRARKAADSAGEEQTLLPVDPMQAAHRRSSQVWPG